jgi:hypothetical protein
MAQKTHLPPYDPKADMRTDYAFIATAVGATLLTLIYLILV